MTIEPTVNTDIKSINLLARSYNTLDYAPRLKELLRGIYPDKDFDQYSKYELHQQLNNILLESYRGEEILKYKLFKKFLSHKGIVAAFEIRVNNSRADFLTINGHTKSFEIKSELDNLSKLSKQAADYLLAFEYNYLVVDEKHITKAKDLVHDSFGLWSYKNGMYKEERKPVLNASMEPEIQLRLLTKKERLITFADTGGEVTNVLLTYDKNQINSDFKKALKNRYRKRWHFLINNKKEILPIDIQFFFNANVKPCYVYRN